MSEWKSIKNGLIWFFAWWLFAHATYAFVMLEWSPFTEWLPRNRAGSLFVATMFGFFGYMIPTPPEKGEG